MRITDRPAPHLFYITAVLLLFLNAITAAAQVETETINLRITGVDYSGFPTVKVRISTSAAGGEPIADLSRLLLRENGLPVDAATTATVPVGADVVMVLDANPDFLQFDDRTGLSRRDKVAASIGRYAGQWMDPAGLDRVSIIVPDETGEGPAFLVTDVSRPDDLAAAAAGYDPVPPRVTPLNAMLGAAIDHLAARPDQGRFGAVMLYTDGARLNRQLDYPALVRAAQAAGVPVFALILGAEASPEEIDNVAGLYRPTNGQYLHMPQPEDADPLYRLLQAQSNQTEITYRSAARQSGTQDVSVSLGNQRVSTSFDLRLEAPDVRIDLPSVSVRRVGSAPDTPLALLQPAALPLTVQVNWPDGQRRALSAVRFFVNGVDQALPITPVVDSAGQLPLVWDISDLEAGGYSLTVEVVDELGFEAIAVPVRVDLEISRPAAPTPTVAPTRAPLVTFPSLPDGAAGLALPAGLLFAALAAGLIWVMHRRRAARAAAGEAPAVVSAAPPPRPTDRHVPILEWLDAEGVAGERIELLSNDVTLGREAESVDIVVDDASVSRLHARVRRSPANEYWLYDEGSSRGTFLNYTRLGLAPRQLQHGDIIQIGRVPIRFVLELPPSAGDPAGHTRPEENP